ncbi:hypothetical protein [Adhaeribacter aquaticus]|uniref:hypothetical protein n=1 Tax=Adhaeribacter aquaticus TaxID=299567 RepID=UPI0012FBDA0A|nr:hypothetical protein [Adhaeribacter aquaticus]
MAGSFHINQEQRRVEITFPQAPGRFTKNELYKNNFSYHPGSKAWIREGLQVQGVGRILAYFDHEAAHSIAA